jgi:hypothetical protein
MKTDEYFYKKCNCDNEAWEEIVVKDDDNYDNRTVIYFHCDECGNDFAVLDYFSDEILYIT